MTRGVEITLDKKRVLRYDINALCTLEERAGLSLSEVMLGNPGVSTLRLLVWAGLLHMTEDATPEEVGEWMQCYLDDGGNFEDLGDKVRRAMEFAGLVDLEEDVETDSGNETAPEGNEHTEASES